MQTILLTGGLGYIGSHVAVELASSGYDIVLLDDLSNSEPFVLDRIAELTGKDIQLEKGDIRDATFLHEVFNKHNIHGIIHLAAKKAVGESVIRPLLYYDVNVSGLITLLKTVNNQPIERFIFSSSCTVYGEPAQLPVDEDTPFGNSPSPYGKTKQMCEHILADWSTKTDCTTVSLRYFNPVGAHPSARIGELPRGIPNNLIPFVTQTAAGLTNGLKIFGGDYHTPDGTAIRDYIHVVDLAKAHVAALESKLDHHEVLNVGTGRGHSVLEIVETFEKVNQLKLPYSLTARRPGDIPMIYGSTRRANEKLQWKAERDLTQMLEDAWRWQQRLMQ